jgi:bifunctional DNase/RNase
MKKIKLEISGISYSQTTSGAYALVLGEVDGKRRLPIIIGSVEAQAIALVLENMATSRPLTHDLFKSFAESFQISVAEVVINKFEEGIFHSQLVCRQHGANDVEVDSRTSDAIAIAVRFNCPIYTYDYILDSAGIRVENEPENESSADSSLEEALSSGASTPAVAKADDYSTKSKEELKEMLRSAIEDEAYEKAGKIRDELARRT